MQLFLLLIGLLIYFVPTIVAAKRDHHQLAAILVLNISGGGVIVFILVGSLYVPTDAAERLAALIAVDIFAGWMFVGWVAALVWACTEVRRTGVYVQGDQVPLSSPDYHSAPPPEERRPLTALDHPSPLTADYLRRAGGN